MKYESLMFRLSPQGVYEWIEELKERRPKVLAEKIVREHLDSPESWDLVVDMRVPKEHREQVKVYLSEFRQKLQNQGRGEL